MRDLEIEEVFAKYWVRIFEAEDVEVTAGVGRDDAHRG